jgi:hypothetical protein
MSWIVVRKPRTTKDTKYHEAFITGWFPWCDFVSFVVKAVHWPCIKI